MKHSKVAAEDVVNLIGWKYFSVWKYTYLCPKHLVEGLLLVQYEKKIDGQTWSVMLPGDCSFSILPVSYSSHDGVSNGLCIVKSNHRGWMGVDHTNVFSTKKALYRHVVLPPTSLKGFSVQTICTHVHVSYLLWRWSSCDPWSHIFCYT